MGKARARLYAFSSWTNGSVKTVLTVEWVPGLILLMVKAGGSKLLRSGALARAAGVSPDTIRHYEKVGVLPRASRTESGYRLYSANALERVLVIRRALGIGFMLAELGEVLKARDAGEVPCQNVYELAQEKLRAIRADIQAMKRTERYLKKVLNDWSKRIREAGPGQKSHLLNSLAGSSRNSVRPANRLRRQSKP